LGGCTDHQLFLCVVYLEFNCVILDHCALSLYCTSRLNQHFSPARHNHLCLNVAKCSSDAYSWWHTEQINFEKHVQLYFSFVALVKPECWNALLHFTFYFWSDKHYFSVLNFFEQCSINKCSMSLIYIYVCVCVCV
jgi:hypothetical protein